MKVIVTGARGLLGRALVPALEQAGHAVLPLKHADVDITQPEALHHPIRTFAPDWVINLAAYTGVDDCESHPEDARRVNALGAQQVALAAAAVGASVLQLSTDYVFDGHGSSPYREDDAPAPASEYGRTKLAGERAVREANPRHQIVRTSWLFGPGGSNFVDTMVRKARAGEALRVVDDQRGSPTFTADLSQQLIRLATSGQFGTYHVTNSGDCTWYDLAAHALSCAGLTVALARTDSKSFARPAPRPSYSVLSNRMAEQVTGVAMPPWQDAVRRHLDAKA